MFLAANLDVASVITAIAGLVTALGWALAQTRNHGAVKQVQESIGPTNGSNLTQLVADVAKLDKYTHDSIHELRKTVAPLASLVPTNPDLLNQAVANKIAERAEQADTGGRRADDPAGTTTGPTVTPQTPATPAQ